VCVVYNPNFKFVFLKQTDTNTLQIPNKYAAEEANQHFQPVQTLNFKFTIKHTREFLSFLLGDAAHSQTVAEIKIHINTKLNFKFPRHTNTEKSYQFQPFFSLTIYLLCTLHIRMHTHIASHHQRASERGKFD
jgi:hypothetical protein